MPPWPVDTSLLTIRYVCDYLMDKPSSSKARSKVKNKRMVRSKVSVELHLLPTVRLHHSALYLYPVTYSAKSYLYPVTQCQWEKLKFWGLTTKPGILEDFLMLAVFSADARDVWATRALISFPFRFAYTLVGCGVFSCSFFGNSVTSSVVSPACVVFVG